MKKLKIAGMAILVLPLLVLAGCPADDEPGPEKMIFANEDDTKTFSIYSNLKFEVEFLEPNSFEDALGIKKGDKVTGKITEASGKWTTSPLSGVASEMRSTNELIDTVMAGGLDVPITLTYTKDANAITAVYVELVGSGVAIVAGEMMGGDYIRK